MRPILLVACFCAAMAAIPAGAQQEEIPKTIAASVGDPFAYAQAEFLSVAEAMPAEKYGFIPSAGEFKGVRSFAEQVKHVACAHFAFFNEIEGKKPPELCEKGGPSPAKSKPELLKYLRESYDYANRVLATMNEKNALERVEGRYGGPNTRLGITSIALWHITDHYGQLVMYLRMNGIVPPPTQQHGLAVR